MPRCQHELVPLVEWPADLAGQFDYYFCPAAGYGACRHCGRIGWYTKYAHRLSFLRPEAEARIRQAAEEWKREHPQPA